MCSVPPYRLCEASLFWTLMYWCWRRNGHLHALLAPLSQRVFVELGRGGEHSIQAPNNTVQWGRAAVMQHNTALKRDIQWTWEILRCPLIPPLLQRCIQYSHWRSVHWKYHVSNARMKILRKKGKKMPITKPVTFPANPVSALRIIKYPGYFYFRRNILDW